MDDTLIQMKQAEEFRECQTGSKKNIDPFGTEIPKLQEGKNILEKLNRMLELELSQSLQAKKTLKQQFELQSCTALLKESQIALIGKEKKELEREVYGLKIENNLLKKNIEFQSSHSQKYEGTEENLRYLERKISNLEGDIQRSTQSYQKPDGKYEAFHHEMEPALLFSQQELLETKNNLKLTDAKLTKLEQQFSEIENERNILIKENKGLSSQLQEKDELLRRSKEHELIREQQIGGIENERNILIKENKSLSSQLQEKDELLRRYKQHELIQQSELEQMLKQPGFNVFFEKIRENNFLRSLIVRKEEQISNLESQMAYLNSHLVEIKSLGCKLEVQLTEEKEEKNKYFEDNNRLMANLKNVLDKNREMRDLLERVTGEKEDAIKKLSEAYMEMERLNEKVNDMHIAKEKIEVNFIEVLNRLKECEDNSKLKSEKLSEMEENCRKLKEKELENIKLLEKLNLMQFHKDDLGEQLNDFWSQWETNENMHSEEKNNLIMDKVKLTADIKNCRKTIHDDAEMIQALYENVNDLNRKLNELKIENEELKFEQEKLKNYINTIQKNNSEMAVSLKEAKDVNAKILSEFQKEKETASNQIQMLENEKNRFQELLNSQARQVLANKNFEKLKEIEQSYNELTRVLDIKEAELNKIKEERSGMIGVDIEDMRNMIKGLQEENENLKEKLKIILFS